MIRPRALLATAVTMFAAGFAALAVLQHRAFSTGRFDLGNLTQAVWSTAEGNVLEITDLSGRQISRLGAHFDPLVAAFAPLWWLWPDPSLLLVAQAGAVALGALPVHWLARKHLDSERAALGFALVYLLYPATQWLVLDDFHPVALATPLLLFAFWFLDEELLAPFALCAGLACLTKEHIGFTVAALGVWYALTHHRPREGLLIAAGGALVAIVAVGWLVPHFAPGGGSPFAGRYEAVGGSPGGIVTTAITDPLQVAGEATQVRDLAYLRDLLAPLAGLPLLAPLVASTTVPELAANLLSSTRTQTSIHFHYTAGAIPGLIVATIFGAARLRSWIGLGTHSAARVAVAVALLAGIVYGPIPLWRHVPFGETLAARDHLVTEHARVAERALAGIPADAAVSATNALGAHLSERRRVFSFPVLREATWVAIDTTRLSYRDDAVAPERGAAALRRLRADPEWKVVFDDDGVLVLRRG